MDFVPDLLNSRKQLVVWAEAFHSCSSFAWVPQAKAECLRGAQCQGDTQREEHTTGQGTVGSQPGFVGRDGDAEQGWLGRPGPGCTMHAVSMLWCSSWGSSAFLPLRVHPLCIPESCERLACSVAWLCRAVKSPNVSFGCFCSS